MERIELRLKIDCFESNSNLFFFFKSQIRTLIKMRSKKQNNSFDETMFNINWENVGEEFR